MGKIKIIFFDIDGTLLRLRAKELSEKTGINQADISKIETGNANPALSTLQRLAEGMGMVLRLEFVPKNL